MPKYGFLGLGIMGAPMAANLVRAGHEVIVWNRTAGKCAPLVDLGAQQASTAAEAVAESDITFAMLADPAAAESVVFGPAGVLEGMSTGKGYVDMSTVDENTSRNIAGRIVAAGGRGRAGGGRIWRRGHCELRAESALGLVEGRREPRPLGASWEFS